jgi:hypothetical protein
VLYRPERRGGPGGQADLAVDVLDVVIGRLRHDVEPIADLAGPQPPGREPQHVQLAPREAARIALPSTGRGRAQHSQSG